MGVAWSGGAARLVPFALLHGYSHHLGWPISRMQHSYRRRSAARTQRRWFRIEPRINGQIRVPEVRLIGAQGEQRGILPINDALRIALELQLDLVEVAPKEKPPVCKLMDYGKFKYDTTVKQREARRHQVRVIVKEIKFRPKIDPHDYATKRDHVVRFLRSGARVKVTVMFRGREQSRPELGTRLLSALAEDVADVGHVESPAKQDGRDMVMVLAPRGMRTAHG